MLHMSMQTTWTASRHAGAAWASQYAASSAVRTSRGRVTAVSCTRPETIVHSEHARAASQPVTVHTSTPPSGPASTSVTCRPSTPSSADAVSSNTMPAASW